MLEQRMTSVRFGSALCVLALPLLLGECGAADDSAPAAAAGASGALGQSGAPDAQAGSPSTDGGAASTSQGGGAVAQEDGGLGGDFPGGSPATDAGAGGALTGAAGGANCAVELQTYSSPTAQHVSSCSVIDYPMNPPVYGDHYPVWAAYKSYSFPLPLGFLVHDLEHGAIVILYHCDDGCPAEVALAQSFIDALPADPRCDDTIKHQVVLAPDPALPTRWAAIAWGHSLTAECFVAPQFRAFYDANLAHGGEDTCADGVDLTANACP